MKRYIMATALAISLMIMPGCALLENKSVQQVSSIVLNGPILINDIETVYGNLEKIQKEEGIFTEEELDVFEDAISTFSIVKVEYETLIALELIPTTEDAMVMWRQARTAYSDSMNIIQSKRDMYDSRTSISIDVMDAHAIRADYDIMTLLSNPTSGNITQALSIISGLVKIGLRVAVLI